MSSKESFSDVLSSSVVLILILLFQLSSKYYTLAYFDVVAMLLVEFLILKIAYGILKENISNLMGHQLNDKNYIEKIETIIKRNKEINGIDELIIIKEGSFYKMDIEVSMNKNMKLKRSHSIIENVERKIESFDSKIEYIIIHIILIKITKNQYMI